MARGLFFELIFASQRLVRRSFAGRETMEADRWRAANPGKTYGELYALTMGEQLDDGSMHRTVGPNVSDRSVRAGKRIFDEFRGFGIEPQHVLVDYGCGSLRIGQHFVHYLDAGNFIGLELSAPALAAGKAVLGAAYEAKLPTLALIDDEILAQVAARRPRWIICNAVVNHMAPEDHVIFLGNVVRLMTDPACTLLIRTRYAPKGRRAGPLNWRVGVSDLAAAAARHGLDMKMAYGMPVKEGWNIGIFTRAATTSRLD